MRDARDFIISFIVNFIVLLAIWALLSLPFIVYAMEIPEQCKGKEVICEMEYCTCTLMHCPQIMKYDKDGNYAGTVDSCSNTCTCVNRCSCDGYNWFEMHKR